MGKAALAVRHPCGKIFVGFCAPTLWVRGALVAKAPETQLNSHDFFIFILLSRNFLSIFLQLKSNKLPKKQGANLLAHEVVGERPLFPQLLPCSLHSIFVVLCLGKAFVNA